ncbi:MAG TPA: hypothetical protein VNT79_15740, partial [Phycisphaerae bacterium]|nr:hypothetical protein [Phycisphaerae bacterium]
NAGTIELVDIDSSWGALLIVTNGTLTNTGTIDVLAGANGTRLLNAQLDNQGIINIGKDMTSNTGGTDHVNSGAIHITAGTTTFSQGVPTPTFTNSGMIDVLAGANLRIVGGGTYVQTSGATQVDGGMELSGTAFEIQAGDLAGSGTVTSNVVVNNSGGVAAPGNSAGTLTINAVYSAGAASSYEVELGGLAPAQFDRLLLSGTAALNGTIDVATIDSFVPFYGNTFIVMTFPSRTGAFANRVFQPLGGGLAFRTRHNPTNVTVLVVRPGDLNCDSAVTLSDVPSFVQLLINPAGYAVSNPGCEVFNGDFNADERTDGHDVQGFVDLLVGA